ncbi:MAG: family 43 glycosylhydrolase [Eubacteriales bacterium]|nr:family 43 glycosylhydrolase [Eubacteriales bacterium]
MMVQNPIVKGFFPDPSICRANGKYYLACSSFQYFPGVPILESDDLLNWKLIGHCLTRQSQVNLHEVNSSGGVFAPTLRYHAGRFYMVTNNNTYQKNFYVYTDDIYGEWSEPIFVEQGGIDPSLFFEGDQVYFTSNGNDENGDGCIMQCQIDIETGQKLTPTTRVWGGAGGRYLESPHLYHFGDWYYLMVAEGGTEYGHMISYARSKDPMGPYENYPHNPVLTNRNVGGNLNRIQGIGHGDLVQDEAGNTFLVCLGYRQIGEWQPFHHLGREVYLTGVHWTEDGWFTAGDAKGTVTAQMEVSGVSGTQQLEGIYDVELSTCPVGDPRWCYMRDYEPDRYEFTGHSIRMKGNTVTLEEASIPTFLGIRQNEFETEYRVRLHSEAAEAGVTCYMDESQHYDLALVQDEEAVSVQVKLRTGDAVGIAGEVVLPSGTQDVALKICSDHEWYHFYLVQDETDIKIAQARTKYLSTEVAGGFTGVLLAMYVIDPENRVAEFSDLTWTQRVS